jgi:hypothetical protein
MAKNPHELALVLGIGGKRPSGPPPTFPREAPSPKPGAPSGGAFTPPENPETEKPVEADETDERVAPERAGLVAPGARCSGCEHFDGQGACEKVAGPIDPDQVCFTFWESKRDAEEEGASPKELMSPDTESSYNSEAAERA